MSTPPWDVASTMAQSSMGPLVTILPIFTIGLPSRRPILMRDLIIEILLSQAAYRDSMVRDRS